MCFLVSRSVLFTWRRRARASESSHGKGRAPRAQSHLSGSRKLRTLVGGGGQIMVMQSGSGTPHAIMGEAVSEQAFKGLRVESPTEEALSCDRPEAGAQRSRLEGSWL